MSEDIGDILENWPHEGGHLSARRIRGDDGRDKLQLRLELGILQMEITGRPDGKRPYGFESLLGYYQNQLKQYRDSGQDEDFHLDERACEMLRAEAAMYYNRYLAAFILEDFALVDADTRRNLDLMDFCYQHAEADTDKHLLEQHRPYVLMMNARARARLALADARPKAALAVVRETIGDVHRHYERFGLDEAGAAGSELAVLGALASEIEQRVPVDPLTKLRKQLDQAIAEERYEDAAVLRDQLRRVARDPAHHEPDQPPPGSGEGA